MKKIDLSLILPCYNEAEHFTDSIKKIVSVLQASGLAYEIIFVEDKSSDDTKKLLLDFVQKNRKLPVRVLLHAHNQGRGQSVVDGMKKSRGKYVGFIDIDCEISPHYIPQCVELLEKRYDAVCGERHYQISLSGLIRALVSKAYASLMQFILQTSLIDTEAGYKFFRREKIMPLLQYVKDTGWFWDTEVMVCAERAGLRIHFLPVEFHRRNDKTSTVRLIPDTLEYIGKLFRFRKALQQKQWAKSTYAIYEYWQHKSPAFSNQYVTFWGIPLTPVGWFLKARHKKIAKMLPSIPGSKFLDVGCGSGIFMEEAIRQGKYAIGIDYSAEMIETARKNLSKYPTSSYELIVGQAQKLPLPKNSVDIVLASGLTDYLTKNETAEFFKEIKRILKKDGHVIITFPKKSSIYAFLRRGTGLKFRQSLLQLPPIETDYTQRDIQKLFKFAHVNIELWDEVFSTMWIVTGKKV